MISLSLIIPTHNRASELIFALNSVARQSLSPEMWECVVVDNRSTDTTQEEFAKFREEHPGLNLRIVREEQPGVSYARNRGIKECRSEFLVFIDDDEHVNPDFLKSYLEFFKSRPTAMVAGGRIIAEYPEGRPAWMSNYVEMPIANPMDFGSEIRPFPRGRVPGGGNMAFRRKIFDRIDAFDSSLGRIGRELIGGEENDLFERLLLSGETIWYVPTAVMWHVIPPRKLTPEYFRKLARNVGISQRLRAEIHNRRFKSRVLEVLKWGATLLLCLTMSPRKSEWLIRLRAGISRGLFLGR